MGRKTMAKTSETPTETPLVKFMVFVSEDCSGVQIFSSSVISGVRATEALKKVSEEIAGASVEAARPMMPVIESSGARNTYTYGTGGAVRFSAPQSAETLRRLRSAIADALI